MSGQRTNVMLITGANVGIGHALARQAAAAGWTVYGGARRAETFGDVQAAGATPVCLDVTDDRTMQEAVAQIETRHGAVDVLVNNAGYGQMGAVEQIAPEQFRKQFETNVFGLARMAQLVLPAMRARGRGRIINVSSMGGEFTFPFAGAYHASKYAVESLNEALRFEVKPFGVDVITIQPAPVRTRLAAAALETLPLDPSSPYAQRISALHRISSMDAGYVTPEQVAAIILHAASARRPRARYKIGAMAHVLPFLRHALSDRLWDRMLHAIYG